MTRASTHGVAGGPSTRPRALAPGCLTDGGPARSDGRLVRGHRGLTAGAVGADAGSAAADHELSDRSVSDVLTADPAGVPSSVSVQQVAVRGPDLHSPVVEAQELLSRVIAGDEGAWNEVVDRYAGLVWSVARSYRLTSAATQDVVQTVWLRLAEHCGRIRQPERLASWLATTTRNEALRVIRGNTRLSPQPIADDLSEPTAPSIEERVGDDATLRAVLRAFAKLSPEDQQLMRLLSAVPPIDYQTIAGRCSAVRSAASARPGPAASSASRSSCRPASTPRKKLLMSVSDDDLLDLVGRALRAADPVPDRVIEGRRAAWTWRTIDEELAELVFDSAAELTGVRSEDTARQLTFHAPGMEIEVMIVDEVSPGASSASSSRPATFTVQLLTSDDVVRDESTDRLGRFAFDAVAPGPVRLAVIDPAGTPIATTEWTLL